MSRCANARCANALRCWAPQGSGAGLRARRVRQGHHGRQRRRPHCAVAAAGLLLALVSCTPGERNPYATMQRALAPKTPADERRTAVVQVSRSSQHDADWARAGYRAIALLDSDTQTRCAALRALSETNDPNALTVALNVLDPNGPSADRVRPADGPVRADATLLISSRCARHVPPETQLPRVRAVLTGLVLQDPERNVRIPAAQGLGRLPGDAATVATLIRGLRDSDFGVVYECESSLVRLTGVTHNCEPTAWEAWQTANADKLFEHAGQTPAGRQPRFRNGVEKSWFDLQRATGTK